MTTYLPIDVRCPCCTHEFKSAMLTSTNTFGGQTTDFNRRAAGASPLPFLITTCPTCGFTEFSGQFDKAEVSEALKAWIAAEITPGLPEKITPATRYAIAARIAIRRDEPASTIANHYLRAAWCCVEFNDRDHEAEYRAAAIDHFTRALETMPPGDMHYFSVVYLIGELNRRIGNSTAARPWFDRVIAEAEAANDPQADQIAALARQQRDEPRDTIG